MSPKTFYILDDFSGGYVDAISAKKIRKNDLTLAQGVRLDTPTGEIRELTQSSDYTVANALTATPTAGFGLFHYASDHIKGSEAADTGENWIVSLDAPNKSIDLYDETSDAWATATATIGITAGGKLVYTFIDETLRFTDANFGSGNQPKRIGYIETKQFKSATTASVPIDNWFVKTTDLTAPTDGGVGDTYPTSGVGFDIKETDGGTDTGGWTDKVFQIALSFVYDSNQESLLYAPPTSSTFSPAANSKISLEVHATKDETAWTIRTSAADNNWIDIAYGGRLFVAVASTGTGNRVMTSPDGITWTIRTSAVDNDWRGIAYGNGLFVAVASSGTGNRVMTSPDGITWTIRTSAADNDWYAVTYGNGLFVAVAITGTGNRVMTSPDGITWTVRTSAADNDWYAVTYGNGLFVAVASSGTGNRVMTSPDGITWTIRTSAADNSWFDVTYGNELFVAVAVTGAGNRVMTSPSGSAYNERITGARFYARENETDDPWTLLADVSLKEGARSTLEGDWAPWSQNAGSATQLKTSSFDSESENIETYEILNGFTSEEAKITISGTGESWATSVISNRRCFVANVKTYSQDSDTAVHMRDKIFYSPVNRFDTFPRSFFIDVVKGDAEEYVKLEAFADRILAFKQRKLYIINISSPQPQNWFLEETYDHMGVNLPSAIVKTESGVAWVNEFAAFFFDGGRLHTLTENKIDPGTWSNFITADSICGYYPLRRRLIVLKDCSGSSVGDVYIYNFNEKNWTAGDTIFTDSKAHTNFITDWNGNLVIAQRNSSTQEMKYWTEGVSGGAVNIDVRTKDIDFDRLGFLNRLYQIKGEYKLGNARTNPFSYSIDGGDSFTAISQTLAKTATWDFFSATFTPVNSQNMMLKLAATGTGTVRFRNFMLEYRPLIKRVT